MRGPWREPRLEAERDRLKASKQTDSSPTSHLDLIHARFSTNEQLESQRGPEPVPRVPYWTNGLELTRRTSTI